MSNNSNDKGYLKIILNRTQNGYDLCKKTFLFKENPEEVPFYIDYENGTIFIVKGNDKIIIGSYETTPHPYGVKVFDDLTNRLIGRVNNEDGLIYFCREDADFAAGKYLPEEECLAYYKPGEIITSITSHNEFTIWGLINGSAIGGAAAFVAVFYNYRFNSVFRDYFTMDDSDFKEKHASYLNPF